MHGVIPREQLKPEAQIFLFFILLPLLSKCLLTVFARDLEKLFTYCYFLLICLRAEQDTASEALSSEKVEVSFTIKTREKSPTMVAHSGSTTLKKLPEINSLQFI